MYQFTVPKHVTKDAMQKIIPRLRVSNSQNTKTNRNSGSGNSNRVSPQRNATVTSSHRTNNRNKNRNNQRLEVRPRPVYIPSRTDVIPAQSLTLDGRGQYSPDQISNAFDPYRGYYNANRWNYNSQRQAASADYGRRYAGTSASADGIPLAVPLGSKRNTGTGNGYQQLNSIRDTGPRLSAANIPDGVNFVWRISGFTECSRTCGGGIQQAKAVCMSRDANLVVTNDNCVPEEKPKLQTIRCNTRICPPSWTEGEWSACSVTCGQGTQTRPVHCKQTLSLRQEIVLSEVKCDRRLRPVTSRSCSGKPCASWKVGEWKKCSVVCGKGTKSREVICKSIEGVAVPDERCLTPKPSTQEMCDMGTCAEGWFYSRWSTNCSTDCGRGYHTRHVYCSAKDGTPLDESKCNGAKPRDRRPCKKQKPCGGYWFEGPWSACSATCGDGSQKRNIVCIKKLGEKLFAVVGEENCAGREKPTSSRSCGKLPTCPSEWFMTGWSQCSATCGTGTKTRSLKCLDANQTASDTCPAKKPRHRQMCNRQSCEQPQLDEDPRCRNKLSLCPLVVQARLCKYPFYMDKCCKACKLYNSRKKSKGQKVNRRSESRTTTRRKS